MKPTTWLDSRFGKITILYDDNSVIVVDKPSRLLTIATDRKESVTLHRILNEHYGTGRIHGHERVSGRECVRGHRIDQGRIFTVHRLDRDTSGVILFAKSFEIKTKLQEGWSSLVDDKRYSAVVEGLIRDDSGEIRSLLAEDKFRRVYVTRDQRFGKQAITRYECIGRSARYALLDVRIETGRKNQIRVQLASIGHPVAGDSKYGAKTNPLGRLCLHAAGLTFIHPVSGGTISVVSPPPREFLRLAT
jgi:23S rRNA pseudouridine1911/1915/1917 synthase